MEKKGQCRIGALSLKYQCINSSIEDVLVGEWRRFLI
jgi:hypothetical protein